MREKYIPHDSLSAGGETIEKKTVVFCAFIFNLSVCFLSFAIILSITFFFEREFLYGAPHYSFSSVCDYDYIFLSFIYTQTKLSVLFQENSLFVILSLYSNFTRIRFVLNLYIE